MKLCKDTNPNIDDNSKLQYLKDGLKSSLRFDILLKDPKNSKEFLKYAQKIEEVESLDEKQVAIDGSDEKSIAISSTANHINRNTLINHLHLSNQVTATYIIKL
jgi:hypothetical protein